MANLITGNHLSTVILNKKKQFPRARNHFLYYCLCLTLKVIKSSKKLHQDLYRLEKCFLENRLNAGDRRVNTIIRNLSRSSTNVYFKRFRAVTLEPPNWVENCFLVQ